MKHFSLIILSTFILFSCTKKHTIKKLEGKWEATKYLFHLDGFGDEEDFIQNGGKFYYDFHNCKPNDNCFVDFTMIDGTDSIIQTLPYEIKGMGKKLDVFDTGLTWHYKIKKLTSTQLHLDVIDDESLSLKIEFIKI